ncbi:Protein N-acetyltransferase, RimJ/RimL family [Clostridium collagenovorans DSM 3089]|uniref:Protein N-acetyltransferase, RimJ/RimL family n=1 Tax=Clostridium collagenovorans DSM 3089 TaxID=1121306 RepID=A0A1M5S6S2_9CLOT|nr:GNAT family N-acetyltransferase [Clostridium collagenovorans]SHH34332.1 Protein N-acetyltransferase, RimJ/RimL family [Clostridium collagenovorans DSM 3089]
MKNIKTNNLIIREAMVEDADEIRILAKQVMGEVIFFSKEPEEFKVTIEQEEEYIRKTSLILVVEIDGKIVGCATLQKGGSARTKHVALFGITILKEYTGLKLGSLLMKKVIEWAEKNEVEKIELEVFAENIPAIKLYEKFGFVVEGRKVKSIKVKDRYIDMLLLGKFIVGRKIF